jgi:hypothetical protein
VAIANLAFKKTNCPIVGYLAEDAFPGRDWLKIGMKKLQSTHASLLAFNDGKWQGNLASFGLVKRKWAEKNYDGNLFYPQYHSHYADTELTLLARAEKLFTYDPHSLVIELDWEKEKKTVNMNDKKLFALRTASGFDGRIIDASLLSIFS